MGLCFTLSLHVLGIQVDGLVLPFPHSLTILGAPSKAVSMIVIRRFPVS